MSTLVAEVALRGVDADADGQAHVSVRDENGVLCLPVTDCETSEELPWNTDLADTALLLRGYRRAEAWRPHTPGHLQARVRPMLQDLTGAPRVRYIVQEPLEHGWSDAREFAHPGAAAEYMAAMAHVEPTMRIVRRTETVMTPHIG